MRSAPALLALALFPCAVAMAGPMETAFGQATAREWIGTAVLAAFGGGVSLLQRIAASQQARTAREDGQRYKPEAIIRISGALFAAAHLSGAMGAGLAAFLISQQQTTVTSGWNFMVAIFLASFGGAQVLDRLTAFYFRGPAREPDPPPK